MAVETLGFRVECELITELLGSQSTRQVATEHIAKKNGFDIPEDELELLPDALESATTVFHRRDGEPVLMDYQVRGFLKAAATVYNGRLPGRNGRPVRALKSKVERTVFVFPREISLILPPGGELDYLERPLRAQTAQGERVTVVRSEMLPAGTTFAFQVEVLPGDITQEIFQTLFDYGYYQGLLQWRSGGYGRFQYELFVE